MVAWTVQRRNRVILVFGTLAVALLALRRAWGAMFPYLFALIMAYLMLPAVNWIDRRLTQRLGRRLGIRPFAIVVVYLITVGIAALFVSMVVPVVTAQFDVFWANREQVFGEGQRLAGDVLVWYRANVPTDIQVQLDEDLRRAGGTVMSAVQTGLTQTVSVVTTTVSFLLAMSIVPFWLFYVLNDQAKVEQAALSMIPPPHRTDVINLIRIIDDMLGAYLRGQLLLCVFAGVMVTIGLMILGVQYPAVLGLLAGALEIVPFIGPLLGLIPIVLVAAIQNPILGIWTIVLYIGLQQVIWTLLAPRLAGNAVHLHPAIIMLVLVVGNEVAGLWGLLLSVPLTAIARDVFRYLYMRFQEEPLEPAEALTRLGKKTG